MNAPVSTDFDELALDPRTHAYCERLAHAFNAAGDGTDAAKLWDACLACFPATLQWVLDDVVTRTAERGRSLAQIDEAIRVISRETDRFADRYAFNGTVEFLQSRDLIEAAAVKHNADPMVIYREWSAAGSALVELRHQVFGKRSSAPKPQSRVPISFCEYCWRSGAESPRGEYHCALHHPHPSNKKYKSARLLKTWRPPPEKAGGRRSIFLFKAIRDQKDRCPSGLHMDDVSFQLLKELLLGRAVEVTDFPAHELDTERLWADFPHCQRYLDAHGTDKQDLLAVIQRLDPIVDAHRDVHTKMHYAHIRDQRLLLSLLRLAEAWMQALMMRAENRGRGRAVDILDVVD